MNKKITTAGILCMMTCAATAYCWETNEKKNVEATSASTSVSIQQTQTPADAAKGKFVPRQCPSFKGQHTSG